MILAPFLEKTSLDRAPGRFADNLFVRKHAKADVLLTTVMGLLRCTPVPVAADGAPCLSPSQPTEPRACFRCSQPSPAPVTDRPPREDTYSATALPAPTHETNSPTRRQCRKPGAVVCRGDPSAEHGRVTTVTAATVYRGGRHHDDGDDGGGRCDGGRGATAAGADGSRGATAAGADGSRGATAAGADGGRGATAFAVRQRPAPTAVAVRRRDVAKVAGVDGGRCRRRSRCDGGTWRRQQVRTTLTVGRRSS